MNKWTEEILSKKVDLIHGHQFRDNDFVEDGLPIVKIGQLSQTGEIDLSNCSFVDKNDFEKFKEYRIYEGDILMALTGATLGKTVRVTKNFGVIFQNYRVGKFQPIDGAINKNFLYYLLISDNIQREMLLKINTAAQGNIGKADFEKIKIKYPDYAIQKKIGSILSTTDLVIDKTHASVSKYKAIKQGMLQDLFSRGIDLKTKKLRPRYIDAPELYKESKLGFIPLEWNVKDFGKEVDLIHGHQFRDYDFKEFGVPVVKIGQVKPENIDLTNCSFVNFGREEEFKNEIIRNGDVLMALTGATLGKACLVKGLNGIVFQNYRVGRFEPIIREDDIDKEFLYYSLIAGELLGQIFNKVNSGAQGNVGKADFEKATFKKPPYNEQLLIAERLQTLEDKLTVDQDFLRKLQQLKQGLMSDLLSGTKTVVVKEELLTQNEN